MQKLEPSLNSSRDSSSQAIGVYAALTAVFLFTLISVTQCLANQPRYLTTDSYKIPPNWTVITSPQQTYTFNLPPGWQWTHDQQAIAAIINNDFAFVETAVSFFRQIDPATEIQFIATPTNGSEAFLLTAASQRMNQLAPEALVTAVQNNVPNLFSTSTETLPGERTFANIGVDFPTESEPWHCLYRYTHNETGGYFLAGCAPKDQFGQVGRDLPDIQASFQLLIK